jgi:hypothetical protein
MYFVNILILFIASYFEFFIYKKYLLKLITAFFIGILFFILLGYNTYTPDLNNYIIHYEDLDEDYIKLAVEPLILFLMETSKNYGLTFQGYQLVFSFLTFSIFFYSILKYSPLPVFVLFNFYFLPFFPDIAQMRFFLGFTMFLFSLQFYKNKKVLFYSYILLGILCHLSILIFLFFISIRNFKFFRKQSICNLIIISGAFLLLFIPKSLFDPILFFINPKLVLYKDYDNVGTYAGTIALFLPFFIINNFIIYFHNKYFIKYHFNLEKKYSINLSIFIDLIQFSNFMILFQYFIRDINRITQNIHILSGIYFSILIYAFIRKNLILKAKLTFVGFVFINLIIFYTQFLMVNNFKYFQVINRTITTNRIFDFIADLLFF